MISWHRASVLLVSRKIINKDDHQVAKVQKVLVDQLKYFQQGRSTRGKSTKVQTMMWSTSSLLLKILRLLKISFDLKEERKFPDRKIIDKEDDVIRWGQKCKPTTVHLVLCFCATMHCNVALFVIYSISRLTLLQSPPSLSLHFYLKDGQDGRDGQDGQNRFSRRRIFLLHFGERRVISLNWGLKGFGD